MAGYKIYVGDGSNNYLKFDGTNLSLSTSGSNALTIKSGGDIKIESGGDLILESATGAATATLQFVGNSRTYTMGVDYDNDILCLYSDTDATGMMYIGIDAGEASKALQQVQIWTKHATSAEIYQMAYQGVGDSAEVTIHGSSESSYITLSVLDTANGDASITLQSGDPQLYGATPLIDADSYVRFTGSLRGGVFLWHFQDSEMADEESKSLPSGTHGAWHAVGQYGATTYVYAEGYVWKNGTVAITTSYPALTWYNTSTDGGICVIDDGTNAKLYNRLGQALDIVFYYFFHT